MWIDWSHFPQKISKSPMRNIVPSCGGRFPWRHFGIVTWLHGIMAVRICMFEWSLGVRDVVNLLIGFTLQRNDSEVSDGFLNLISSYSFDARTMCGFYKRALSATRDRTQQFQSEPHYTRVVRLSNSGERALNGNGYAYWQQRYLKNFPSICHHKFLLYIIWCFNLSFW